MKIDSLYVASALVSVALVGGAFEIASRFPRYQIAAGPTFAFRMDVKTGAVEICAVGLKDRPVVNSGPIEKPVERQKNPFDIDVLGKGKTEAPRHVQPVDCE